MRKVNAIALVAALLASISVNLYLVGSSRDETPMIAPEDQKWAEKALAGQAARQGASRETIERLNEVHVMHFPQEVCVALVPAQGVVGGSNVTCFATETEEVSRIYEIGE